MPADGAWDCTACGRENDPVRTYCGQCGTARRARCVRCDFDANREEDRFCGGCGVALDAGQEASPGGEALGAKERWRLEDSYEILAKVEQDRLLQQDDAAEMLTQQEVNALFFGADGG